MKMTNHTSEFYSIDNYLSDQDLHPSLDLDQGVTLIWPVPDPERISNDPKMTSGNVKT